jgi:hypothetical protein
VQLWSIAAEQQWKRVLIAAHTWRATLDAVGDPSKNPDPWDLELSQRTLEFESHFLLVAISQVRSYAKAILRRTGDHRLTAAIANFDRDGTDAVAIRDYATHLDEYVVGKGLARKTRTIPESAGLNFIVTTDEPAHEVTEVSLQFDTETVRLGKATKAAVELADAVDPIWWEHVDRGQQAWRSATGQT